MQIITGKYRGRRLMCPESARPTLQRVKTSLFSIINEYIDENSAILDLFAGSGSLGFECLSRGSKTVVFCDDNKEAVNTIKKNLEGVDTSLYKILNMNYKDVLLSFAKLKSQFDIIFLDPPYADGLIPAVVDLIIRYELLRDNGIIVLETDKKNILQHIPNGCIIEKERSYGTANIMILKKDI